MKSYINCFDFSQTILTGNRGGNDSERSREHYVSH